MNAYTLINKLRKARRRHGLSAGAQALYYELLAINNDEEWTETFKCTASDLFGPLGVSEKTLGNYREELMMAELVGYKSGKSKRSASIYCLFGSSFDSMIGGNIYHQYEYQTEHQPVVKTPDLNKIKRKSKIKIVVEDDDKAQARKKEIERAINDFTEIDPNSNAGFNPNHTHLPDERKKIPPKKEIPLLEEMIGHIAESKSCHWWNVVEFYLATGVGWDKLDEAERQTYYDRRTELFKKFYASKQDNYKIRLPSVNDIATNFYHWVPTELNREKLQNLNGHAINRSKHPGNGNTKPAQSAKDKRAELLSLNQQSGEFLSGIDY